MSTANWVALNDPGDDRRTREGVARDGAVHLALVGDADRRAAILQVEPVSSFYNNVVKRAGDLCVAVVVGLLVLPIGLATALAIRLTMGKGVFYTQARVGLGGEVFRVYKFRSMRTDRRADREAIDFPDRRVNHKDPNDPRHTGVGRFIRKWSLDELPQIINVLKGEMSLVGPRPELVDVVERYPEAWMHQRHTVRPGITGRWQVSGRGDRPMHECVDVDIEYVRTMSLWNDLKILIVTPMKALGTGH